MNKKRRKLLVLVLIATLVLLLTVVFIVNRNNKPSELSIEQKIENKKAIDDLNDLDELNALKEDFIRQLYKQEKGLEDSTIIESNYEKWKEDNKEYLDQIKVEIIDDE